MVSRQLDLDAVPAGTYVNTAELAQNGLVLNRFCYELRIPANRDAYKADPDEQMAAYGVAPEDQALIRAKDWLGLQRRGLNIFPLLRLAQLHGDNLEAVAAQLRGESVDDYIASRDYELFGAVRPTPKGT